MSNTSMIATVAPPWVEYRRKLAVLFEQDPKIIVDDIVSTAGGYTMSIKVADHEKFVALDRLLVKEVIFGNVTLTIDLIDSNSDSDTDYLALYAKVFEGNGRVKDIRTVEAMGFTRSYIRFQPDVLQFPNDDLSDANGNWSGLAQDIAREVFANNTHGVSFCTADIRENNGEITPCGTEFVSV